MGIVLVTGGNRGIGLAVVRALADDGHDVLLGSRDLEAGQREATELLSAAGRVTAIELDVTRPDVLAAAAERAEEEHGRVDVIVNNAGVDYDTDQQTLIADLARVRGIFEVNFYGPWQVVQAFLLLLHRSDSPRIVNVSSGAGALHDMGGGVPGYGTSKAALNALTRKLAAELEDDGVLVNAVCPGWVRTEMGGEAADRSPEEAAAGIVWAATLPDDGPTGGFFRDGERIAW